MANGTRILPHTAHTPLPTGPLSGLGGHVGLNQQGTSTAPRPPPLSQLPSHSWTRDLHDLLVPAGSPEGDEGEAAGGSVVEGDTDAPEVHGDTERLLLRLAQHGSLVHVGVLRGSTELWVPPKPITCNPATKH